MRKIKWLPDSGSMLTINAPNGINLEQFMALLIEAGGSLSLEKNLVTEKVTKATFLTAEAILPDGDITLFSTIKNPKGNEVSRKKLYAQIAKFKKRDGDRAIEYFYGFTTMTNNVLEGKVNLYSKKAPVTGSKSKLPKVTKVAASKGKTTSRPKKINREEAEARAAQKSFKGNIYNKYQ